MRLVVLASGRGSNLEAIMETVKIGKLRAEIVSVVSDNANAKALEKAQSHGIPTKVLSIKNFQSRQDYDDALAKAIEDAGVDYVVLAGFMRVLGNGFVRRFRNRIINIHPSLLPAFPGVNAQAQALDYGVKVSGCTVHFVDEGMDTGPVIAQAAVSVYDNDTADSLTQRILVQEHKLLPNVLQMLSEERVEVSNRKVSIKRNNLNREDGGL